MESDTIGLISAIAVLAVAGLSIAAGGGWYVRARQQQQACAPHAEPAARGPATTATIPPSQNHDHPPIRVRELSLTERQYFTQAWTALQATFVDDPRAAVVSADTLIQELLRCRGYPVDDAIEVDRLCNHYPKVLMNYRKAHLLAEDGDHASLEALREALIRFRDLYAGLIQVDEAEERAPNWPDLQNASRR